LRSEVRGPPLLFTLHSLLFTVSRPGRRGNLRAACGVVDSGSRPTPEEPFGARAEDSLFPASERLLQRSSWDGRWPTYHWPRPAVLRRICFPTLWPRCAQFGFRSIIVLSGLHLPRATDSRSRSDQCFPGLAGEFREIVIGSISRSLFISFISSRFSLRSRLRFRGVPRSSPERDGATPPEWIVSEVFSKGE
jgi:hypothetical protein